MSVKLSIRHLHKTYGKVTTLTDANFEVNEGEFVVLVGPSGCGKSTLLRMIAGLETVSSGEIWIGGRKANDLPPAERGIAMVFQDYALYPHMRVRENLAFGLRNRGVAKDEIEMRVAEAAQLLQIQELLDRKPAKLSGGQRQRVAIGRALVRKPEIFLFDEPLSNLDAQLRFQTRLELASLHREIGATSIYVTHDQVEAMTLADRIVVLDKGKIQQVGSPLDLYHTPCNSFVASFIGSRGMNFFAGKLDPGPSSVFHAAGTELHLSPGSVGSAAGGVTLGVRPEALKPVLDGELDPSHWVSGIDGKVKHIEAQGHETHLVAQIDGLQIVSRTSDEREGEQLRKLKVRQNVRFAVNTNQLHWFNPQGERIA